MVSQIPYMLAQANFPLSTLECLLPSFLTQQAREIEQESGTFMQIPGTEEREGFFWGEILLTPTPRHVS